MTYIEEKLSPYWEKSMLFFLIVGQTLVICLTALQDNYLMKLFTFVAYGTFNILGALFFFLIEYRMFVHIRIYEDRFESYMFRKKLCRINKDDKIYYRIFTAPESAFTKPTYIAISTERIIYDENKRPTLFKSAKPLTLSYNMKTQIVIPYNIETQHYFDLDNWYKCYNCE